MVVVKFPTNGYGDKLINACIIKPGYQKAMGDFLSHLFRWTEPLIVVTSCLVILFLLPILLLFGKESSYLKLSRIYNISRLSILTLFHRITYIYLIILPLAFYINQHPPCIKAGIKIESISMIYNFPHPKYSSFCFVMLYISSLFGSSKVKQKSKFIVLGLLIVLSIHWILCGDVSIAQGIFTLCFSFVLHYYSMRIPFWFLNVESFFIPLISIIIFNYNKERFLKDTKTIGKEITALSLWISDLYMLIKYRMSRTGFISIGRQIDLDIETSSKKGGYFSVLSSESEVSFTNYLKKDLRDSLFSVVLFTVGLIVRNYISGSIVGSYSGLV